MPVSVYLGESCLHLSIGTLILATRKLQGEADMCNIQSIKSGELAGSVHWGMQSLMD